MRQVSGTLRIDLAQYREKEAFSMFSSELDQETLQQLKKGAIMVELLKQYVNSPMTVEEQVISLYAGTQDFLNQQPLEKIAAIEKGLITFVKDKYSNVLDEIKKSGELTPAIKESLGNIIKEYLRNTL